ncbi:MAG: hypothetical protein ABII74_07560 [Elusimicrobiota bacterium]
MVNEIIAEEFGLVYLENFENMLSGEIKHLSGAPLTAFNSEEYLEFLSLTGPVKMLAEKTNFSDADARRAEMKWVSGYSKENKKFYEKGFNYKEFQTHYECLNLLNGYFVEGKRYGMERENAENLAKAFGYDIKKRPEDLIKEIRKDFAILQVLNEHMGVLRKNTQNIEKLKELIKNEKKIAAKMNLSLVPKEEIPEELKKYKENLYEKGFAWPPFEIHLKHIEEIYDYFNKRSGGGDEKRVEALVKIFGYLRENNELDNFQLINDREIMWDLKEIIEPAAGIKTNFWKDSIVFLGVEGLLFKATGNREFSIIDQGQALLNGLAGFGEKILSIPISWLVIGAIGLIVAGITILGIKDPFSALDYYLQSKGNLIYAIRQYLGDLFSNTKMRNDLEINKIPTLPGTAQRNLLYAL